MTSKARNTMRNVNGDSTSKVSVLRRSSRKRKPVEPVVEAAQVKKRRRVARARNGKNRIVKIDKFDKFDKIVDLPVDIVFEIFGWLNPVDLLSLSRTSKNWRALLMTRSSIAVWRTARSNLDGLPDCPDEFSEPQYAELAFGRSCFFCSRSSAAGRILWAARLRTCEKCLHSAHFMTSLPEQYLESKTNEIPEDLLKTNLPCVRVVTVHGCVGTWTRYIPRDVYFGLHDEYLEAQEKEAWLTRYRERMESMKLHTTAFELWDRCHGFKIKQA